MTREQIIGNIVIGLFLIVAGAVLHPLLKRAWKWINRRSPLTPQTKGQLVTNLAMYEDSLERLNYLSGHAKDLFLYLIQLMMSALLLSVIAFCVYVFRLLMRDAPYVEFPLLVVVVLLVFAGVFCGVGLWEAGRMSDKKIAATKEGIQKHIDDINAALHPPD